VALPLFLKSLPASATTAYNAIRSAHRQGISARAMTPIISKTVVPISRRNVNLVIAGLKGHDRGVADLRFLKRGAVPDPTRIQFALSDIKTKYSFTLEVKGINPLTGLEESRHTQVTTDELLSRDDLDALAQSTIEQRPGSESFDEVSFVVVGAYQRDPSKFPRQESI
jgi:hypothetical protein